MQAARPSEVPECWARASIDSSSAERGARVIRFEESGARRLQLVAALDESKPDARVHDGISD